MIYTYDFYPIDSRMYILLEHSKALVIDPCISEEALQLLRENDVEELLVLLTHEHYDHISGVNWFREHISSVEVFCSEKCAEALPEPSKNFSDFWEVLFLGKDEDTQEYVKNMNIQSYSCEADRTFEEECRMLWEGHSLWLKRTPGHSAGSICILLDENILFSGDSLVTGYPTILRFPGGSRKDFKSVTIPFLESLDQETIVYPGHGEKQPLGQYGLSL